MNATNCIFLSPKHLACKKQEWQHPKLSVEGDIIIEKKILCARSQDESHISISRAEQELFPFEKLGDSKYLYSCA